MVVVSQVAMLELQSQDRSRGEILRLDQLVWLELLDQLVGVGEAIYVEVIWGGSESVKLIHLCSVW